MRRKNTWFTIFISLSKIIIFVSAAVGVFAFLAERKEELSKRKDATNMHIFNGIYERYIKRPLDAFLATGALIVFSPIILVTAVLVRLKLGKPVFFTQERPGRNEKIFKLYKFRTMTDEKDENGDLLPDEVRLKNFGKKLRSTSLDEMPELINIIKGDMAVVGPRPLLVRYLKRYNSHQKRRHEVRPGFTGLAQVNGRNSISWEDKFNLDVKYVDNITFMGDLKIIVDTVKTVIKREGINGGDSATMTEFMGSPQ